jgi:hypothetical protein
MCLQPAERDIGTPEHIKKYRKSFKEQHGVTIVILMIARPTTDWSMTLYRPRSTPMGWSLRNLKELVTS